MLGVDSLIGGAFDLGGAALNYYGAKQANKANREMAREQMGFQERMSNTAYQRAMADMQAAGLNPMLAFQQGGASTPGGSTATMQNEMAPAVGSALQARQVRAQIAQTNALTSLMKAELPEKEKAAEIFSGKGGQWLKWFKELVGPVTSSAGAVSKFIR
jgi:hypothetical protein